MLQHRPPLWRSNKIRFVIIIVGGFLFFQYIFGYSVYNITKLDYRYITQYYYGSEKKTLSETDAVRTQGSDTKSTEVLPQHQPFISKNDSSFTADDSWANSTNVTDLLLNVTTGVLSTTTVTTASISVDNKTMSPQPASLEMCPVLPPVLGELQRFFS